ncbi:MAG: adenosylcobinamide amidohydrolase [Halobacteriales archaeon]
MFEPAVADGVLQVRRPGTRWLSTGLDGGFVDAPAAYNVSVPEGFERTDVAAYATERRRRAGFEAPGPALLTGVDLEHARGARAEPVEVYATVGLSNPTALAVPPDAGPADDRRSSLDGPGRAGTVNLVVGTTRALADGALATLLALVAEAKAATLTALAGFTGTTTDAVVVGTDPDGDPVRFAGSATPVGAAAMAAVRDAVAASFRSRYADRMPPDSVTDAAYGRRLDREADVFEV